MASHYEAIVALRSERADLVSKAGEILTKARTEERDLTSDETQEFTKLHDDADGKKGKIETLERQRASEEKLEDLEDRAKDEGGTPAVEALRRGPELRSKIIRAWARGRPEHLNDEEHRSAKEMGINFGTSEMSLQLSRRAPRTPAEARALSTTANTIGGHLVPTILRTALEEALLAFGGMRQVSTILRTAGGGDLDIPTTDDTANKGEILAENAAVNEQDVVFSKLTLQSFKYSSKAVRVSVELLQDSVINVEEMLGRLLGIRLGRITNDHYTTGTGSAQPNGIVTASTLGKTTASPTAITYSELMDLKHSVDPAYRESPTWMFHDKILAELKKILDGNNNPIWRTGFAFGEPDTIDGHPFVINQSMVSTVAASDKTIIFGDLSKYWIRDVLDLVLLVLRERFADNHQVGFFAFMRTDGDLLDAGTNPVKFLQQST